MGKMVFNLAMICFVVLVSLGLVLAAEASWTDIGGGRLKVTAILVDPQQPQNIFFGSEEGVFRSTDGGKNWSSVFFLKGQNQAVHALVYANPDKNSLYAATGSGLFFSPDQAKSWKKVFQGKNELERDCQAVVVLEGGIYLGTKAGLFFSFDRGQSWKSQPNELGYSQILAIAFKNNVEGNHEVYAACVKGLFKTRSQSPSWDKIFSATSIQNDLEQIEPDEDQEEGVETSEIRSVAIERENNGRIYLAASSGVYCSGDNGLSWQRISDQGLLKKDVRSIIAGSGSRLYAATKAGLFVFQEGLWHDLSLRLVCGQVNSFSFDGAANLYVASSKGLFKSQSLDLIGQNSSQSQNDLLDNVPTIEQVQQAAMRFAEVEPDKIKNWRRLAAKKAWLPQMSLGGNRNTVDLWHWESGSTTKDGDDNLRKGHDSFDWDVSLSWDLGDIVWSEAQNSIDVRSRLTVQLRNDILDEVTKIYFERLRVKEDLASLDIWDRKKKREKELRVKELNAYLDGLTGGYFSQKTLKDKS